MTAARKKIDPEVWARSQSTNKGKFSGNPEACAWVKRVVELRVSGESNASYGDIARMLSDPDTDPFLPVTESGVRQYISNKLPDLHMKLRVNG